MTNEEQKEGQKRLAAMQDDGLAKSKEIMTWAKVILWVGLGLTFLVGIPLIILYGIGLLVMICGGILFPLIYLFMSAFSILLKKVSMIERSLNSNTPTKITLLEQHQFGALVQKISLIEQHLNKDDEKKSE